MNSRFVRMICVALAAVLGLGLLAGVGPVTVSAAVESRSLATLLEEGKIKPLGRTQVHSVTVGETAREYLATDWPATGFEVVVTHNEPQTLKLTYHASYNCYWTVCVDGEQIQRISYGAKAYSEKSIGEIYAHVPAGTHTVSFYKTGGISDSESQYWDLYQLSYSGTLENAPANKDLYIEFIGDSYSAGSGTLGQYIPGKGWSADDHSAIHAFPFYTAQKLDADYSVVARGGIGLFVGLSEQEGTAQKKGMQDVYTYTSGFRTGLGQYDFARRADVVVIELGANDSIDPKDQFKTIEYWTELLENFTDTVREKNPTAHIVYLSHNMQKHKAMRGIVEARAESDPKLYAYYFPHSGNGSAAKDTQTAGHPNHFDSQELAAGLSNFIATNVLPQPTTPQGTYDDVEYYVSVNGSDTNDGRSIETAMKTVKKAYDTATANTLPAGSRLVLYLEGEVLYTDVGGNQAIFSTTRKTADGKKLPILVTTYNYTPGGTKAVLDTAHEAVNGGNAAQGIYNDATFKDVAIQGTTRPVETKDSDGNPITVYYRDYTIHCGYNNVVFDNVTFQHAVDSTVPEGQATANPQGWRINCGFFSTITPSESNGEIASTVTFRNGDYTNLSTVTTSLNSQSGTDVTSLPFTTHTIIIEEGAKMGTVTNRSGKFSPGSTTVEIRGGTVNQYIGTANGTSSSRFAISGDINFVMTGGTLKGERFITTGNYVTLDGNLNNTISGGTIHIVPQGNLAEDKTSSSQYYGFMFGGSNQVTVKDLTNNISGGQFILESNRTYTSEGAVKNVDAGFYFGGAGGFSGQNVTNNISGGVFLYRQGAVPSGYAGFHFGQHSGKIHGTLTNNISGGIFDNTDAGTTGNFYFGPRATNTAVGKIVNVFGVQGTTKGPRFLSADGTSIQLGSGWNHAGITGTNAGSRDYVPDPETDCTDTVAIHNIIYGGFFQQEVYCSTNGGANKNSQGKVYTSFTNGSVQNEVYGGTFRGTFFGSGNSPVYGKVTTDIYGGYFCSIYGARAAKIYDGVELNIHGLKEYWYLDSNCKIYAGGSGGTITASTEGRPALALNIIPDNPALLTLNMPIYAKGSGGTISGTTTVNVTGGTFPQGFKIEGKTVGECLASGKAVFSNPSGSKVSYNSSDSSISGSVIVANDGPSYQNEVVYYVSEYGDDCLFGHTPASAKASISAAHTQAVLDNRNSNQFPVGTRFTIYVSGQVLNNPGNTQQLGGRALRSGSGELHCPVTVATAPGQARATVVIDYHTVNSGNGSGYVFNDYTFKSIDIFAKANLATGYVMNSLYAAGCELTFDDANIITDGLATKNATTWFVGADHFNTSGINPLLAENHPYNGTLTFKNGDYTNLSAAAVRANNIYRSSGSVTENPQMHCKLIIEDGAHMGTVYNCYGKNEVGSAAVEIRGGTVDIYKGTNSGTSTTIESYATNMTTTVSGGTVNSYVGTGDYVNFTGNITNTLSGGLITGNRYSALGSTVTLTGNLTNNITGGELKILPTNTAQEDGIWLSGRNTINIKGNVENNISGGKVSSHFTTMNGTKGINGSIYMGTRSSGKIEGNLTNNISGGNIFATRASGVTANNCTLYGGCFTGGITGTLTNNITGGTFDQYLGNIQLTGQGIDTYAGKVVNIFGSQADGTGPVINVTGSSVSLYSGWGREGVTSNINTYPTANSDTVVVSTTIYGGTFHDTVNCAQNHADAENSTSTTYVKGSAQLDIYGGTFQKKVTLTGATGIYGNLDVNIYGGIFNSTLDSSIVNVKEGGVFTCDISGGTFTNGFKVTGMKVAEALADGYRLVTTAGNEPIVLPEDALSYEETSVTVVPDAVLDPDLMFSGASLTLYEDLAVKFKAKADLFGEGGFTEPYAVFTYGQRASIVEGYVSGGQMVFPMRGIAPNRIGDTIVATIYATKDGKLYAGNPVTYSVKEYCDRMLLRYSDNEKLRTLLVDLLNYGALAQQYTGYNTDKLVNADLGDTQKAWGTAETPAIESIANLEYEKVEAPTVTWTGGGLSLRDSVAIRLRLKTDSLEGLTVKVVMGEKTYELDAFSVADKAGEYYVYFRGLNASQMRTAITATAYRDGQAVSDTVLYSVESYAASKLDAADAYLADLVKAMMRYGDSAENYVK